MSAAVSGCHSCPSSTARHIAAIGPRSASRCLPATGRQDAIGPFRRMGMRTNRALLLDRGPSACVASQAIGDWTANDAIAWTGSHRGVFLHGWVSLRDRGRAREVRKPLRAFPVVDAVFLLELLVVTQISTFRRTLTGIYSLTVTIMVSPRLTTRGRSVVTRNRIDWSGRSEPSDREDSVGTVGDFRG